VEMLNPARSQNHHPLFQTMLVLQNQATADLDLPGIVVTDESRRVGFSKFDLTFSLAEEYDETGSPTGLEGTLEFSTELFEATTAQALVNRLREVLAAVVADPDQRVHTVDLLTAEERARILGDGRGEVRRFSPSTVPAAFGAQVVRGSG
ncbi:condensation domain-containing protein, partial [Streptomyces sp. DT171]